MVNDNDKPKVKILHYYELNEVDRYLHKKFGIHLNDLNGTYLKNNTFSSFVSFYHWLDDNFGIPKDLIYRVKAGQVKKAEKEIEKVVKIIIDNFGLNGTAYLKRS